MLIEGRQNITPVAKEFKAKGVTDLPTFEHPSYTYQSPEALDVWYKMKPELYALTAVLIDRVVDRAIRTKHERPPFGLMSFDLAVVNLQAPPTPISAIERIVNDQDLASAMRATLTRSAIEEVEFLENPDNLNDTTRQAVSVYNRLKQLVVFRQRYIENDDHTEDPAAFIRRGSGTAAAIMGGVVNVLPEVYEANGLELNPQELTQTAINSYPLVADLAMRHMYDFGIVLTRLEEGSKFFKRFNSKYFVLKDISSGIQLTITEDAKNYDEDIAQELHSRNHIGGATIGCPAMVNFNGESAVKKLWNWHLELAEAIYSYRFR